jgi:uncharacterized phage-associated protein
MYSANDIAKYVIAAFNQKRKHITNLKLQKILYYIQVEFIKKYNKPAFADEIQAWRHGPVVPSVYYEYNQFVADPIEVDNDKPNVQLSGHYKTVADRVIAKYEDTPAWTLVDYTRQEYPWKHCYFPGANNPISVSDIIKGIQSHE